MAFSKIHAIVITVTLVLLTCFTTARESHHIDHPAPETAPASSPDYAPLSGGVSIGDLEPSLSTYKHKIVASNNCGTGGSAQGGFPGQNWGAMGGSGAGWGGMSGLGMQYSAAGSASSFIGCVAFFVVLLATGLMYL